MPVVLIETTTSGIKYKIWLAKLIFFRSNLQKFENKIEWNMRQKDNLSKISYLCIARSWNKENDKNRKLQFDNLVSKTTEIK